MGGMEGQLEKLQIHCRPGGRKRLAELCEVGFPGSLTEEIEERCSWNESESGELPPTDWIFERFPVRHTPETDPHGYKLVHKSGLSILHCGDSGPCEEIEQRARNSDIVILEMGVPDFVKSPHHHNPSDVVSCQMRHPHTSVLVTHNFSKSQGSEIGFEIPILPEGILQIEDGDCLEISESGQFSLIRK